MRRHQAAGLVAGLDIPVAKPEPGCHRLAVQFEKPEAEPAQIEGDRRELP